MQCSHCGVVSLALVKSFCLRLLLHRLPACQPAHVHPQVSLALPMTLTWATCSLQRAQLATQSSSSSSSFFPWERWQELCAYLVTLCLLPWLVSVSFPSFLSLCLSACLIIKMTKYLEKIINFVCMFGKIISRRYKVPFMSCLYLLSPSREQTKKTFCLRTVAAATAAAADASPTWRWQLVKELQQ